jgi:hypothetical protein
MTLAGQLPQKLPLIHPILKGLPPIDEHHRHFVIELSPQLAVTIHIYFLPGETAAAGELRKALLHQFAKVTTLPRVNHDLA